MQGAGAFTTGGVLRRCMVLLYDANKSFFMVFFLFGRWQFRFFSPNFFIAFSSTVSLERGGWRAERREGEAGVDPVIAGSKSLE